eukprot:1207632-Prymnesium_polylepis.2
MPANRQSPPCLLCPGQVKAICDTDSNEVAVALIDLTLAAGTRATGGTGGTGAPPPSLSQLVSAATGGSVRVSSFFDWRVARHIGSLLLGLRGTCEEAAFTSVPLDAPAFVAKLRE